MLTSLFLIFTLGLLFSGICKKIKLPSLIGMIIAGVLIGPFAFNLLDSKVLSISADLRQLALIIILIRAGLSLDINKLKEVGRPAFFMCFIPACFEILGAILIGPRLLNITKIESLLIGSILAAVSPAVVVPNMLRLIDEGYGVEKNIPQLILAGASVDDIFVIVIFTSVLGIMSGDELSYLTMINIPFSIIFGIIIGIVFGLVIIKIFKKTNMSLSYKVISILCVSFLLLYVEELLNNKFSALLSIMTIAITIYNKKPNLSGDLSNRFFNLWEGAEIILFVLVGSTVDIRYIEKAGIFTIIFILSLLAFRMLGVFISLLGTKLNLKERIFCMIAYMPKATVQAAIGGIPLSMGLPIGQTAITVSVLSILITASLGSIGINKTYKRLLNKSVR